jgi:hypothetical protein
MEATHDCGWVPLGSALIFDWKYLGRAPAARGATAWCTTLDGETVILRAWGEEMTSSFEFLFATDERLAGMVIVHVERQEAGRVRVTTSIEVESHISLTDTSDFKEHPRTLVLGRPSRNIVVKQGTFPTHALPPLSSSAAEIFEISPDSALLTTAGAWISEILRAARDHVRMVETAPQPRSKTERAPVRPAAAQRETLDGPRRVPQTTPTPKQSANGSSDAVRAVEKTGCPDKIVCTTNTGESFDIAGEETYVGRSKQCAIVLKSQRVSRKHACITREADGFYINDLGAANGIWAGSEKIDRERIKSGDQFIVGDVVLSFSYN